MLKTIPLSAIPAQQFNVVLNDQACTITLRQKSTGLFLDMALAGTTIAQGLLCRNLVKVLRAGYRGFVGDLVFMDTQGSSDPAYAGLGTRFVLMYLETSNT